MPSGHSRSGSCLWNGRLSSYCDESVGSSERPKSRLLCFSDHLDYGRNHQFDFHQRHEHCGGAVSHYEY